MALRKRSNRIGADDRVAIGFAFARVAYAAALIAVPSKAGGPWLGDAIDGGGGRVAARALVARDGLVSVGLARAAWRREPLRPWLAVLVASDLADIGSTLAERANLPDHSAPGTVVLAGAAAVVGVVLFRSSN